jgi:hypothetical protein
VLTNSSGEPVDPEPVVVRMAGLPVAALTGLRFDETFARAEHILVTRERLAASGDELSDLLYEVIGALPAAADARPGLVGLRRALHQIRVPGRREWNDELAALLPVPVAQRIRAWVEDVWSYERARRELPDVLARERADREERLRVTVGDPAFRRALALAGPSLLDEVEKWRADPAHRPKPQKLLRLVKYLSRAAAKTSPYSTFMASGFGRWQAAGPVVTQYPDRAARGLVELDGRYLADLRRALLDHPELRPHARVRPNPSLVRTADRAEFIGPPPAESIVSVPLVPAVRACLDLLARYPETTVTELAGLLGNAAASGGGAGAAAAFVAKLIEAGLLEAVLPVPDHAVDPLAGLARWARRGPAGLAGLIEEVRAELRRDVPVADVPAQRARQAALARATRVLADRLGFAVPPGGAELHEAAVVTEPVAELGRDRWAPVLADLDVLRGFLDIVDPKLPVRLAVGEYLRERFGPGARVPFPALYRAVQEAIGGAGAGPAAHDLRVLLGPGAVAWVAALAGCRSPRLRELDRLRAEARAAALPPADPDGVVRVDPATLAKLVAGWPEWIDPPGSVGCYVQLLPAGPGGGDEPRVALNVVHGGYGRGPGRLRYQIAELDRAADPGSPVADTARPGTVLAELGGLLGSTLNIRAPTAPYEIDYPGTVSARPEHERIRLGDLVAVHDPATDRAHLTAPGTAGRVVPLHLGMSSDFTLPPAARFLERAFGAAYLVHPSAPPLISVDTFTGADELVRYPRVEVGRVVLQRARWFTRAGRVPTRSRGEPDAEYLLRLLGWLRETGIPTHCFVRTWGADPGGGEQAKARKPMYVDVANWLLALDFERQVAAGSYVVFDEALPPPTEAAAGPRVTEFFIQIGEGWDDRG